MKKIIIAFLSMSTLVLSSTINEETIAQKENLSFSFNGESFEDLIKKGLIIPTGNVDGEFMQFMDGYGFTSHLSVSQTEDQIYVTYEKSGTVPYRTIFSDGKRNLQPESIAQGFLEGSIGKLGNVTPTVKIEEVTYSENVEKFNAKDTITIAEHGTLIHSKKISFIGFNILKTPYMFLLPIEGTDQKAQYRITKVLIEPIPYSFFVPGFNTSFLISGTINFDKNSVELIAHNANIRLYFQK